MNTPISVFVLLISYLPLYNLAAAQPDINQYNVKWHAPSSNSYGSMPIGDGDIGMNVWAEEDGDLLFYISKTDAWSENGRLLKFGRIRDGD